MLNTLERTLTAASNVATGLSRRSNSVRIDPYAMAVEPGSSSYYGPHANDSTLAQEQYQYYAGHVYSAIQILARRISKQPLLMARVGKPKDKRRSLKSYIDCGFAKYESLPQHVKSVAPEDLEIIQNHPLLDAIQWPNELMTRSIMLNVTISSWCVTGRAFWIITDTDNGGHDLVSVPSTWLTPDHEDDRGHLVSQWILRPIGASQEEEVKIPGSRVVQFYFPDPSDPFGAISPLQAQARSILTDDSISTTQYKMFKNAINPSMAVMVGEAATGDGKRQMKLDPFQRRQLMTWIKQEFQGAEQFGQPIILDAIIRDVKQLMNKPMEMSFKDSGSWVKTRIFEGFGVNPISAGQVEGSNRASSGVADWHLCFTPDTTILTDKGCTPIESVEVGDMVLTHKGRWRPVSKTMARDFSGDMVSVRAAGQNVPILSTPEHPYLVRSASGGVDWKAAKEIKEGDSLGIPVSSESEIPEIRVADWIDAVPYRTKSEKYKDRDWLEAAYSENNTYQIAQHCGVDAVVIQRSMKKLGIRTRTPKECHDRRLGVKVLPAAESQGMVRLRTNGATQGIPATISVTPELAFVLGLWLAEGHASMTGGIGFSLNAETEMHLKQVIDDALLPIVGRPTKTYLSDVHKGVQFVVASAPLVALLKSMFGRNCHTKHIPPCVSRWPRAQVEQFIAGYLTGDGGVNQNRRHVQFTTVSPGIAYGMKSLLATIGSPCHVYWYAPKKPTAIHGKVTKTRRATYQGRIYGADADRIGALFGESFTKRRVPKPNRGLHDGHFAWSVIQEVGTVPYSGPVHNLAVDEDESYTTFAGVAHNCSNTVNPMLDMMGEIITVKAVPVFKGSSERLKAWFAPCEAFDPDLTLKKYDLGLKYGFVTRNEGRVGLFGLPPREGMDDVAVSNRVVNQPAGALSDPDAPTPASEPDPDRDPDEIKSLTFVPAGKVIGYDDEPPKTVRKSKTPESRWLKVHGEAERSMAKPLAAFIHDQVESAASKIETLPHSLTAADVIAPELWTDALKVIVKPFLKEQGYAGAALQLLAKKSHKATAFDFQLPANVSSAIDEAIDGILDYGYWDDISETTLDDIARQLKLGLQNNETNQQLADRIRETLGVEYYTGRAAAIARTETTGALNAGAFVSLEELADEGIVEGKEWLPILDNDTREAHAEMVGDKAIVPVNEPFDVGGYPAMYPGDPSLPARLRTNCRCSLAGVIVGASGKSHGASSCPVHGTSV